MDGLDVVIVLRRLLDGLYLVWPGEAPRVALLWFSPRLVNRIGRGPRTRHWCGWLWRGRVLWLASLGRCPFPWVTSVLSRLLLRVALEGTLGVSPHQWPTLPSAHVLPLGHLVVLCEYYVLWPHVDRQLIVVNFRDVRDCGCWEGELYLLPPPLQTHTWMESSTCPRMWPRSGCSLLCSAVLPCLSAVPPCLAWKSWRGCAVLWAILPCMKILIRDRYWNRGVPFHFLGISDGFHPLRSAGAVPAPAPSVQCVPPPPCCHPSPTQYVILWLDVC